jgi:hypothetical protein
MAWLRSRTATVVLLAAALIAVSAARAGAQAAATPTGDPTKPHKSVYGKLERIDPSLNAVFMKSDSGQRMAWQVGAAVIAEAKAMKPGTPLIVIYRLIGTSDKKVTAIAFPGTAASPIYVNTTGSGVEVRSGPMVGGVCGGPGDEATVNQSTIPIGGRAEVLDACWCCAARGDSCVPANKSGAGIAYLVSCFE